MRMFPAKCPNCGGYMEPVIKSDAYHNHSLVDDTWKCDICDETFEGVGS